MAMSGRFYLLLLVLMSTIVSPAFAGQIVGELDKTRGNIADQFIYTLSVEGSFSGRPSFPKIDGVSVTMGGTEQSTQIFNGAVTRSVRFNYVLEAASPGTYEIPEIELVIDGKSEKTLPLSFVVEAIDPKQQQEEDYFVERELSKDKVYEGEVFTLTNRIYIGAEIDGRPQVAPLEPPPGFRVYGFDSSNNYTKNLGGQTFQVIEQKYILIADSSGSYSIPPFVAQVMVPSKNKRSRRDLFGFFNPSGTPQRMKSAASAVTVVPLPSEGRSRDFSGLVGSFDLQVSVEPRELPAGESATIAVTVEGLGETEGMKDIELFLDNRSVKVYRDKPVDGDSLNYENGILGKREYKFAVIANSPRTIDLGKVTLNYFDPTTGEYQEVQKQLGQLKVLAGTQKNINSLPQASVETPTTKREITKLGTDILGLHSPERVFEDQGVKESSKYILWTVFIGGLFFLFGSYLLSQRQLDREERLAKQRYKHAYKDFLKNKNEILSHCPQEKRLNLLDGALRDYLSHRLMVSLQSMTVQEIKLALKDRGIAGSDLDSLISLLMEIERIRFGQNNSYDLAVLLESTEKNILKLEKQF